MTMMHRRLKRCLTKISSEILFREIYAVGLVARRVGLKKSAQVELDTANVFSWISCNALNLHSIHTILVDLL